MVAGYVCVTCGDEAPTAREAAKHGRMHAVTEFSRTAKVWPIPSWGVDCAGSCGGSAGWHMVSSVEGVLHCECPANAPKVECRHRRAAKAQGRVLPDPKVAETLAHLVKAGLAVLADPTVAPTLRLARVQQNYTALATQLNYITSAAPPAEAPGEPAPQPRREPVPISRAARDAAGMWEV